MQPLAYFSNCIREEARFSEKLELDYTYPEWSGNAIAKLPIAKLPIAIGDFAIAIVQISISS